MIVTPVSPNDLRQITVDADGTVEQTVLSQVRYSELEVSSLFCITQHVDKAIRPPCTASIPVTLFLSARRSPCAFGAPPSPVHIGTGKAACHMPLMQSAQYLAYLA